MSGLREDFQAVVQQAADRLARFPNSDMITPTLWRVIAGPARSGKTTLARAYAAALQEAGLAAGVHSYYAGDAPYVEDVVRHFAAAKNGVLIIDEPYRATADGFNAAFGQMLQAREDNSCIVVMTGYKPEMEAHLARLPRPLLSRWTPEVHETARSFTPAECAAFDAARALEKQQAEQQRQLEARIESWRQLPDVDVSAKAVTALRTVRFTRKGPAS